MAYREAHDLVDQVVDLPSGYWQVIKYGLGLQSLEEAVESIQGDKEEQERKSQERRNKGVLEWGFDAIMKFLLGEDMIWTKATDSSTTTTDNTNISPYQQEKQNSPYFEDILKQNDARYQEFWIMMHGNLNGYTVEGAYNLFHGLAP